MIEEGKEGRGGRIRKGGIIVAAPKHIQLSLLVPVAAANCAAPPSVIAGEHATLQL